MSTDLLTKLRLNTPGAWEEFYDSIASDLRSYIARIGGKNPDDLLGETMLHIVRDLPTFHGTSEHLRPWAFKIAHHRVIDASRRRKSRPDEVPSDVTEMDTPYAPLSAPLELGEITEALKALTPDQRSVIWLRYVSDMSLEDVAVVLEKTPEAVAALTHRAIRQLRKAISTS